MRLSTHNATHSSSVTALSSKNQQEYRSTNNLPITIIAPYFTPFKCVVLHQNVHQRSIHSLCLLHYVSNPLCKQTPPCFCHLLILPNSLLTIKQFLISIDQAALSLEHALSPALAGHVKVPQSTDQVFQSPDA